MVPEGVQREGDYYSYSCKVSEVQVLEVQVQVVGEEYKVLRWQVSSITDWQEEETVKLWDGNMK